MIKFDKGKDGKSYSKIAREFQQKLRNSSSKKTPYNLIPELLAMPSGLSDKEKNFLSYFVENDFANLDQLITLRPDQFDSKHQEILMIAASLNVQQLDGKSDASKRWKKALETIFGYKSFNQIIGRKWFLDELDFKTCPYCNINLFAEVSNKTSSTTKLILFEIDHFYKKSTHPWFSMSFFNLVPSCLVCNQRLKGNANVGYSTHLHPYADSFHQLAEFDTVPDSRLFLPQVERIDLLCITEAHLERTKKTIRLYRLEELYQYYIHEAEQVHEEFAQMAQSRSRKDPILPGIKNSIITDHDLSEIRRRHRIPANESEIGKFSLGKLRFDLYQKLIP